jgi:serine/threonine-protein kinase SRK2
VRKLNSGTFGFVKLVVDLDTGKQCAVKFLDRGEKVSKYVEREILNHRRLVHPHIVRFKEVLLTDVHICIVMEYASGGDMFDYVLKRGGLCEDEARWFFQQLIVATDFVHRTGLANRDIKLENTLLDSSPKPLIKLCDFGYSKHEKLQSAPGSRVGTPAYLAPEVIRTSKGGTYDGKVADIWSCGVMLYVMLTGSYPFERAGDKTSPQRLQLMISRILKVEYRFPNNVNPSPELQDLLNRILRSDPAERITIEGIFNHPWFCVNLPPGVQEMNKTMKIPTSGYQSEEEILSLLREAERFGGKLQKPSLENQIDEELTGHSHRP